MPHLDPVGGAVQGVHRLGRGGDAVDAVPLEVAVVQRRVDEEGARRQGGDQLVVVEGHLGVAAQVVAHAQHVALLHPALQVAVLVVEHRVETAARHHRLQPRLEHGGEDAVVAAERVADGGEAGLPAHEGQGFQVVEPAHVVPDRLHRAAPEAERLQVGLVLRQQRVAGRQRHVAAFGQFGGVLAVGFAAQADHDLVADAVLGRVQAEHRRCRPAVQRRLRDAQVGRHPAAGRGLVAHQPAHVAAAVGLLERLRLEGAAHGVARQRSGDAFKAGDRLAPARLPFGGRRRPLQRAVGVAVLEQVGAAEAAQRRDVGGVGGEQAGQQAEGGEEAHASSTAPAPPPCGRAAGRVRETSGGKPATSACNRGARW